MILDVLGAEIGEMKRILWGFLFWILAIGLSGRLAAGAETYKARADAAFWARWRAAAAAANQSRSNRVAQEKRAAEFWAKMLYIEGKVIQHSSQRVHVQTERMSHLITGGPIPPAAFPHILLLGYSNAANVMVGSRIECQAYYVTNVSYRNLRGDSVKVPAYSCQVPAHIAPRRR